MRIHYNVRVDAVAVAQVAAVRRVDRGERRVQEGAAILIRDAVEQGEPPRLEQVHAPALADAQGRPEREERPRLGLAEEPRRAARHSAGSVPKRKRWRSKFWLRMRLPSSSARSGSRRAHRHAPPATRPRRGPRQAKRRRRRRPPLPR